MCTVGTFPEGRQCSLPKVRRGRLIPQVGLGQIDVMIVSVEDHLNTNVIDSDYRQISLSVSPNRLESASLGPNISIGLSSRLKIHALS